MLRGFLSGIIWGVIVSGLIAAATSLLAPLPGRDALRALAGQGTAGQTTDPAQPETAPPTQDTEQNTATSDDMAPASGADTRPAPTPQTGAVTGALTSPEPEENSGANPVVADVDAPVQPQPDISTPAQPDTDDEPSISVDPVQPVLPNVDESGPALPPPETGATPQVTAPQTDTGAAIDDGVRDEAVIDEGPDAGADRDMTPSAEAPEPARDTAPSQQSDDEATALPTITPQDQTPETAQNAADAGLKPGLGRPAIRLTENPSQHQTNRLPTMNDPVDNTENTADPRADGTIIEKPVQRFAAAFSNPENKPVMAIILIDEGDSGIDTSVLSGFPYPLSFAINTLAADAGARMAAHREKGFEVLAMIDLPEFANASDVEVAMPAHLQALPQAVAVLEGLQDGLQGSRELSDQVTAFVKASGHGLVMLPNGLNTAQKLAARDGVPSAIVFRDFDGKGQNPAAIRRFLDQAAFKAGREGGVVMLGRLRPDTVSALLLWGLADRASTVALAPVSALLSTQ